MANVEMIQLEEKRAQAKDAHPSEGTSHSAAASHAAAAAVASHLASAAHTLGSTAPVNTYSTPGDNTFNWPFDPDSGVPNIGDNIDDVLHSLELGWENALSYLQNNPDSYNGVIKLVPYIIYLGKNYEHLTPSQKTEFNSIVTDFGPVGHSLGDVLMEAVMEGAFYQSPLNAQGTGFDFTNVNNLMRYLVATFTNLSSINPLFGDLATSALQEEQTVQYMEQHCVVSLPDGNSNQLVLTDKHGAYMGFKQFVGQEMINIALVLQPFDQTQQQGQTISDGIADYYKGRIEAIEKEFKGNPWAIFIQMMAIILGLSDDMSRVMNGYADTVSDLKKCVDLVNKILPLMNANQYPTDSSGLTAGHVNATAADHAKQLMGYMAQLQQMLDSNPKLKSVASLVDQSLSAIFNTPASGGTYWSQYSVSEGIYEIPKGCEVQYTPTGGAVQSVNGPKTIYVGPNGGGFSVKITDPTVFSETIGSLGMNTTLDIGGKEVPIQGLGNYYGTAESLLDILSAPDNASSIVNQMTSIESTLSSPNSGLQNQMQNESSVITEFLAFFKAGMGSDGVIGGVIANANKQMQSSNS